MITKDLFKSVLIEPAQQGCDTLLVVSGYATATMASRHFEEILKLKPAKNIRLQLLVGMCRQDGLTTGNHEAFKSLVSEIYPTHFECQYVVKGTPVHSKTYVWLKDKNPVCAFNGSANYTQSAFFERNREALSSCEPKIGYDIYRTVEKDTLDCREPDIEKKIVIQDSSFFARRILHPELITEPIPEVGLDSLEKVKVRLLTSNGKMHEHAGLNWGMRKERNFRPEAYISLPPNVYNTEYFPKRKIHFTVISDDGIRFICSRGQKTNASAIQTPLKNTDFGVYFRKRIGVGENTPITKEDLERYGRTDVDFYKIDDDTYLMDFSVNK